MPQRAMGGLLVVAGLILAAAFVFVGANLTEAAQRGPRWRRRLLGAAIGFLAAIGLVPVGSSKIAADLVVCYGGGAFQSTAWLNPITDTKQVLERLTAQVQLLQKFEAEAKLDKETVEKALATAEADLMALDLDLTLATFEKDSDKQAAARTRYEAHKAVDTLRLRLSPPKSLTDSLQWTRLLATWKAVEAAGAKEGPIDANEKERLLEAIDRSYNDAQALKQVGLLSEGEGDFMTAKIGILGLRVWGKATTGKVDAATASPLSFMCYQPLQILPPPQSSLRDLGTRLLILEKLAGADKLHPAATEKILATCEADLRNLADLKTDEEKKQAEKVAPAVRTAIEKIREKIKAVETPVKEK